MSTLTALREAFDQPQAPIPPPLWKHQESALRFLFDRYEDDAPGATLAMEMGTGKTRPTIEFLARLAHDGELQNAIVFAPRSVISVWQQQLSQYWPRDLGAPLVYAHAGGPAQRAADRAAATQGHRYGKQAFILLANYEAFARKSGALLQWVEANDWDVLVADEGHRLKAPSGKTSKAIGAIAARASTKFNIALTGTPLPQGLLDAFGLMRFVDPSIFGPSYVAFRAAYTRPARPHERRDPNTVWFSPRGGPAEAYITCNEERFERLLAPSMYRVEASEVLDLPPVINHSVMVKLNIEAARIYRDVADTLIAEIEEGAITAANAMVKMLRLAQITSGSVTDDLHNSRVVSDAKAEALRDFLTDLSVDEPVVVFTRFTADVDMVRDVAESLGGVGELTGRANDLAAWQRGEFRVLAVNPQAGGVGVDMTRAHYAVWFSLPWSLAQYEQARARLVRPGQTKSVIFTTIAALLDSGAATVDSTVLANLQAKGKSNAALLDNIRQHLTELR